MLLIQVSSIQVSITLSLPLFQNKQLCKVTVLPTLIFDFLSAFVFERQIINNILVTYEILHYLRTKNKGKKGFMSLKLDMSKAYDLVE